jgi:hypothetical protein
VAKVEGKTLVDRLRILASSYQLLDAREAAVQVAEAAVDKFGDFAYETVIGLAEYYLERANPSRAFEIVQTAIKHGPQDLGVIIF